mmetsp:Transcript_54096/g.113093  ORF Transcript_54096/g.113093 Transcript_54096/m.113093 type:complete len:108 (-) Transcript_54096:1460-1783(-)
MVRLEFLVNEEKEVKMVLLARVLRGLLVLLDPPESLFEALEDKGVDVGSGEGLARQGRQALLACLVCQVVGVGAHGDRLVPPDLPVHQAKQGSKDKMVFQVNQEFLV